MSRKYVYLWICPLVIPARGCLARRLFFAVLSILRRRPATRGAKELRPYVVDAFIGDNCYYHRATVKVIEQHT
jgi:hypothetical protein